MISHVFVGTNDRSRATAFYAVVMNAMGWRRRHSKTTLHLALWRPNFWKQ